MSTKEIYKTDVILYSDQFYTCGAVTPPNRSKVYTKIKKYNEKYKLLSLYKVLLYSKIKSITNRFW